MIQKRAILYPVTKESEILLKYSSLVEKVSVVGVLQLEEAVKNSSYVMIRSYDTDRYDMAVIGDGTILKEDMQEKIYSIITEIVSYKKDIIILYRIKHEQYEKINNICRQNGAEFDIITGLQVEDNKYLPKIYTINTPIIVVAGINEGTDKFETQLLLRKYFVNAGYKVSQIGTKRFSSLFGMYAFPEFMYQEIQEQDKIIRFNTLCKSIEKKENPDIIIVGIPGGIIPINNEFTNRFGMTAIEIGYSINADIMVLNINYDDYTDDFYGEMSLLAKYKFNIDRLYFGMTNHKIDFQRSREANALRFVTVDMEKIKSKISQNKNIYENTEYGINDLCNKIVEELSGSDIQVI